MTRMMSKTNFVKFEASKQFFMFWNQRSSTQKHKESSRISFRKRTSSKLVSMC